MKNFLDEIVCNHFVSTVSTKNTVSQDFILHHYDKYIPEYEKNQKISISKEQLHLLDDMRHKMYDKVNFPKTDRKKKIVISKGKVDLSH